MKNKLWSVLALTSAAAISLTACAGGGGDEAATGDKEALKIGVSAPLSGPVAAAGTGQACGIRAYFEAANADGGINGYPVDVTVVDNVYEPATAATDAREFAADEAFAVTVIGTATAEAARPALQPQGIPLFGTGDGASFVPPKWEGDFGYYPQYADDAIGAVDFIADELGADSFSFVNVSGAGEAATEAVPGAAENVGIELASNQAIPVSATDFSPYAQSLKSAGAPVVYAQLTDTQFSNLQKEADAIGYEPDWVLWPIGFGPTYLELAGDLAEGVYVGQWATPSTETDDPEVQAYIDAIELLDEPDCSDPSETNLQTGYGVAAVMAHGIEQITADGEEPTREAFIEALQNVESQSIATTNEITYSSDSHAGIDTVSYWQVTDGVLKNVTDWQPILK